ncbi:MAG: hypothetical protein IPJ55_16800 [Chloracidobacterium sp.]|nr:hypothetical protein [Chloracidobacterium sp.]
MSSGHSGDSSGRSLEDSNKYVQDQLNPLIDKYASSLGITLTPEQKADILSKIYTPFTTGKSTYNGVPIVFDADRGVAIEEAKNFLLPVLSQIKLNPTTGNEQIIKAGEVIKSVLGRDATPDESAYFAKELAQGKTAYELQQELMSLPEYQKTLAAKDRETLGAELLTQQQLAFQKATPTIISQFMKAGRIGSSGLDAALANAQKELEQQRQGYLGQVGYQDLSSIRGNAYNNYNNATNQFKDIFGTVGQTSTNYNLLGSAIQRMNEQSDYARQQNDYMKYLQMAGSNNGVAGALQGAMGGAQAGSAAGPWGALIGAGVGGAAGYYGTKK